MSLGAAVLDHQPGIEHAFERGPCLRHCADRRLDNFAHGAATELRRHDRRRRVGAHAASVRALVAVVSAFVVLRRGKRQRRHAVDQREEACLLAAQELLDHHLRARRAEGAGEAGVDGGFGFGHRLGDGHTLAGGKPVGLDHDGERLSRHIILCGARIGEAGIGGSRNAGPRAEILGEALGAFEPGRFLRWPEHLDPLPLEIVGEAGNERRLGADDHEADLSVPAEVGDARVIADIERDDLGNLRDPGIARCAIKHI